MGEIPITRKFESSPLDAPQAEHVFTCRRRADGIALVATIMTGHSLMIFFDEGIWVTIAFILGTMLFGVGLIGLIINAIHAGIVTGIWRYVTFASTLILMIVPAIPSG